MFPLLLLSHEDKIMVCVTHHPITTSSYNKPTVFDMKQGPHVALRQDGLRFSTAVTGHWPALLSDVSHSALEVIKNRKDPSILHLPLQPCSTAL